MRKSIALAAVAACTAVSGCGRVHAEDGGASISRTYQVGNFQKIEVAGPYDVEVRTGANPSVSARGSEKLLGRTVVEVRGDRLLIRPEQNKGWFHFGWSTHGHANFRVTVPQLSGATIAGSGDIKVDKVQGDRFEGTVAGSGGIDVGAMNVQTLKLAIAGSGSAKAGSGKAQSADYDSTLAASRRSRRKCRSQGREASRRTRPVARTSASWARATSTFRAAPSAASARPGPETSAALKAAFSML
jgi:hypothetical protein